MLIRGLRNLGASWKGNGFILFACTKRTKSTPEVCEPLDSGDDSNRRSIRDFSEVTGFHQVTGNAENCIFPDIAGNDLNRCDAPALQHKIRANSKRIAVFFANSRLRVVRMGGRGWKRIALDSN